MIDWILIVALGILVIPFVTELTYLWLKGIRDVWRFLKSFFED